MEQLTRIFPHDLLTFNNAADFISSKNPLPNWAKDSLRQAKIAVVRRGKIKEDKIPVGLRGYERNERLAGFLDINRAVKQYHPNYFIKNESWKKLPPERQKMPAFLALRKLVPILKDYNWGISGSLAYEMATGVKMVKDTPEHQSDLDIIMPNLPKMTAQEASSFLKELNQFGVHADVQVVHGENGFSLEEYAQNRAPEILLKTDTGPKLSADPFADIQRG